jgi:lipoate-protein ligase A
VPQSLLQRRDLSGQFVSCMQFPVFHNLSQSVDIQMAQDEVLFEKVRSGLMDGFLRFYTMDVPSVTVGRFTGRGREDVLKTVVKGDMPVVRRMTGGGVVYHGEDLVFSLGVQTSHLPDLKSVKQSYCLIHQALQEAFRQAGIQTELVNIQTAVKGNESSVSQEACFQNPVEGDLLFGSKKIAGGAQRRYPDAFLHQGSIDLSLVEGAAGDLPRWCKLFQTAFEKMFSRSFENETMEYKMLEEAETLARTKYALLEELAA